MKEKRTCYGCKELEHETKYCKKQDRIILNNQTDFGCLYFDALGEKADVEIHRGNYPKDEAAPEMVKTVYFPADVVERIENIEKGHLEQIKHDMREFNSRLDQLESCGRVTCDRVEKLEKNAKANNACIEAHTGRLERLERQQASGLSKIDKLETGERATDFCLADQNERLVKIELCAENNIGKRFEETLTYRKLQQRLKKLENGCFTVAQGEADVTKVRVNNKVLIGTCKDCKHYKPYFGNSKSMLGDCRCTSSIAIDSTVTVNDDFGCIHWEQKK